MVAAVDTRIGGSEIDRQASGRLQLFGCCDGTYYAMSSSFVNRWLIVLLLRTRCTMLRRIDVLLALHGALQCTYKTYKAVS